MARPPRFGPIQEDLFAFSADNAFVGLKNLEPFMGTSWFSLEKKPRHEPIRHEYRNYWVEIKPSVDGIATYWDQDILLFIYSQLIGGIRNGDEVSRKVFFTGPDFFRFTGQKWSGSNDYKGVLKSLRRLQGTTIRTNVKRTESLDHAEQGIGWISEYRSYLSNNVTTFEVVIPEPFFKTVSNRQTWLALDRSYFGIMGGLERFLYTWGRKATGYKHDDTWEESFHLIYEKSGSRAKIEKFRFQLRRIIDQQTIPGYTLGEYVCPKRGPVLTLKRDIWHPLLMTTKKIRRSQLPKPRNRQLHQYDLDLDTQ